MRQLSGETVTMLTSGNVKSCITVKIETDTPVLITTAGFILDYNGESYNSANGVEEIEGAKAVTSMDLNEFEFAFSMTDGFLRNQILGTNFIGRKFSMKKHFLDDNNIIIDTISLFSGKVSEYKDELSDSEATINLVVPNNWSNYQSVNNYSTTTRSRQKRVPNSTAFDFCSRSSESVYWGTN